MPTNRPRPGTIEYTRTRRRQWGCVCVLLGLIVVLLLTTAYLCLFRSVPLRISTETTYITEPLKSNGKEVDYFAAWEEAAYPEGIATEKNGYRLIIKHLGMSTELEPALFGQLCEKLGLAADSSHPDMTFEEPFTFLNAYVESENFDESVIDRLLNEGRSDKQGPAEEGSLDTEPRAEEFDEDELNSDWAMGGGFERDPLFVLDERHGKPWTLEELPMMEDWLTQNAPALSLIAEAVGQPLFRMPLLRHGEEDLAKNSSHRERSRPRSIARALCTRAQYRVATGNVDGAIEDVITCKRLGRHLQQEGQTVPILIGIFLEGMADAVGIAGSLEHPPAKKQLSQLVDDLNDLPASGELQKTLLSARYQTLDLVQAMAHGRRTIDDWDLIIPVPPSFGYDWSVFAGCVNEHYDTYATTGSLRWSSPTPMAMLTIRSRSRMMADEFALSMLSALETTREAQRRITCSERIQRITLAMLLYECDHGALPPAYSVDLDGNPLHSWRVLLLPYLGQEKLHDQIRLNEPWDSEHNRQFHEEAVAFYQCPSAQLLPGQTAYSVVVGPETAFQGSEGKALSSFGPNSATMILVVERNDPVCWMDPTREVPQAAAEAGINMLERSAVGIGSRHPGGAQIGHRDGAVRFISETIDNEIFRELLQGTASQLP